jgi:hypothetical protein
MRPGNLKEKSSEISGTSLANLNWLFFLWRQIEQPKA